MSRHPVYGTSGFEQLFDVQSTVDPIVKHYTDEFQKKALIGMGVLLVAIVGMGIYVKHG
jgi:hypothetical protein